MNADVLTTRVADGIAVITLGSARRIYFDEEMGDELTEALGGLAGAADVRVVVVTGGAPAMGASSTRPWRCARARQNQ
jgi:enoyl-CoA hydratase/carnithine racemase